MPIFCLEFEMTRFEKSLLCEPQGVHTEDLIYLPLLNDCAHLHIPGDMPPRLLCGMI